MMDLPPHECTWPICRAAFITKPGAEPVRTVLAMARTPGDLVALPELFVCGRSPDGKSGASLLGGYMLLNRGSRAELIPQTETRQEWGGGAGFALDVIGYSLELVTKSYADSPILWSVYWREVAFPATVVG